jgi:hypothetical protein
MHEAASHLIVVGALEARTEQPELYLLGLVYTAWISRTLFRGVCLLEREKQYAEAIHYLTVLLEVTAGAVVIHRLFLVCARVLTTRPSVAPDAVPEAMSKSRSLVASAGHGPAAQQPSGRGDCCVREGAGGG